MIGSERAGPELIAAIGRRRVLVIAEPGSEEERYLDTIGAEANCGDFRNQHILMRPDPSKATLLEEFLHGTQSRLGLIASTADLPAAEYHVKDFMIRHRRLLGLGAEDVRRLTLLRDAGL